MAAGPLSAQATGTISGRVVAAASAQPLSSVQVYLQGTSRGTLTNAQGRFILLNVEPGTYQARAERVGYAPASREVTVQPGATVEVVFDMAEQALGLDEIIVTGTAGAARRREVGNSVAQVNTADIDEPIISTDALLQGRAAGINVTEQSGSVGGGAKIRLRGNVSAAMSNQPIIYLDGVRVRSEGLPKNVGALGYGGRGANVVYGPLNDISPQDIERIEVIKGAAATTLYGTEAAAGVIQIFTKRGQRGEARWDLQVDQGFARVHEFGPTEDFRGRALVVPASEDEAPPYGEPDDPSFMYMDPYLRDTAWRQKYALSVRGGSEDLSYFLSGSFSDAEGVLPNDAEDKVSIRGNFSATPLRGLTLDWNTSYARTDIAQTPAGPNAQGIILNTFRRNRNYLGTTEPDVIRRLLEYENTEVIDRFITGVTATWAPSGAFSNRLTVGYDLLEDAAGSVRPFGFIQAPNGIAHANEFQSTTLTLDYVGTWRTGLADDLDGSFSFGGQSVTTREHSVQTYGEDFPGPGEVTVSSAAQTFGFEDEIRVINAGFFGQALLGYRDRYFLTLGARVDGNSSFGEDLGLEVYPKASVSWVVSEEDFWGDWGQLKLRGAYGQSGRAPGAFDAVRTWNPIGWGGQPAFRPLNLGNAALGPERTTELEVGFDAAILDNRLSVEFTYYDQTTDDALFEVTQVPSGGFLGSQLDNVGKIANSGIELSVHSTLLEGAEWGVDLGATLSTNDSEVLDLGGAPPFSIGGSGFIVEGQPVPVVRGSCVDNPDAIADPVIVPDCNYGPNLPTEIVGVTTEVRMPWGLTFRGRGEYQGGHWAYNINDGEAFARGIRWPNCFNVLPAIDQGNLSDVNAIERARCISTFADRDFAIYPMDFFKVRELSLTAPIPFDLPGARSAAITFSARNAIRWQKAKYSFADPETSGGFLRGDTGMNQATQTVGGSIPTPAFYTLSARVSF